MQSRLGQRSASFVLMIALASSPFSLLRPRLRLCHLRGAHAQTASGLIEITSCVEIRRKDLARLSQPWGSGSSISRSYPTLANVWKDDEVLGARLITPPDQLHSSSNSLYSWNGYDVKGLEDGRFNMIGVLSGGFGRSSIALYSSRPLDYNSACS